MITWQLSLEIIFSIVGVCCLFASAFYFVRGIYGLLKMANREK